MIQNIFSHHAIALDDIYPKMIIFKSCLVIVLFLKITKAMLFFCCIDIILLRCILFV